MSVLGLTVLFFSGAYAGQIEVPIDIGVGPALATFTGPMSEDGALHYAISISAAAVLDQEFLRRHRNRVPAQYRSIVNSMGEARIGHAAVPDTLYISPNNQGTSVYGANWSPIGVSMPLVNGNDWFKAGLNAELIATYAYISSDDEKIGTNHFFRPGLGVGGGVMLGLFAGFSLTADWRSRFYPPQELGGAFLELGDLSESIWHIGQGSIELHYKFPFKTNI
jgi:hypothetical protein